MGMLILRQKYFFNLYPRLENSTTRITMTTTILSLVVEDKTENKVVFLIDQSSRKEVIADWITRYGDIIRTTIVITQLSL